MLGLAAYFLSSQERSGSVFQIDKFALKNGIESVMKRLIIFFKKSGGENEDTFI
jgi:hypothetical protein